jgi:hypothetical protein
MNLQITTLVNFFILASISWPPEKSEMGQVR